MDKFKKVSKYTLNILTIVNALLLGLSPIWEWNLEKVTASIVVFCSVISVYLLGNKVIDKIDEHEERGE